MRRILNGINYPLGHAVVNNNFNFNLWQKIDDVFRAAIELGVAALATGQWSSTATPLAQQFAARLAALN